MALETCVNGVANALATSEEDFGVSTLLIAAFLRDMSEDSALEVLDQLLAMHAPIAGIGLDSAEVGNPPSKFERLYQRASEAGLRRIAHAGEEGPAPTSPRPWTYFTWNGSITASAVWKTRM